MRPPVQRTGPGIGERLPGQSPPELGSLRLPELRNLRRDSQRDEADLSYVRRLVQGRIDILRAELARRRDPETPVVDRLSEILADTPSRHRSSARHVTLTTPRSDEFRRWRPRRSPRSNSPTSTPAPTRSCTPRWGGSSVTSSRSPAAVTNCNVPLTIAAPRSPAGTVMGKHK